MKKLTLALAMVLTMTYGGSVVSAEFYDTQRHWSYDAVTVMCEDGILAGYDDGSFRPDDEMRINEFIKALILAAGTKISAATDAVDWFEPYRKSAEENGIIAEGEFSDFTAYITRIEIARLIVRALSEKYTHELPLYARVISDYTDIPSEDSDDALKVVSKGIIIGDQSGAFNTTSTATRGEAAQILLRMKYPAYRKNIQFIL